MQTHAHRRIIDADADAEAAPRIESEFHNLYDAMYGEEGGSKALARALGVNPETVFRWLQGKREVPEAILEYMRTAAYDVDDIKEHNAEWIAELVSQFGDNPPIVATAVKQIAYELSSRPSARVRDDVPAPG